MVQCNNIFALNGALQSGLLRSTWMKTGPYYATRAPPPRRLPEAEAATNEEIAAADPRLPASTP